MASKTKGASPITLSPRSPNPLVDLRLHHDHATVDQDRVRCSAQHERQRENEQRVRSGPDEEGRERRTSSATPRVMLVLIIRPLCS